MHEYTAGHSQGVLAAHATREASEVCGYFTHRLRQDMSILDVGCGPGSITVGLAKLVPQGKVVGVDYVESVIDHASKLADKPINCSFTVGDVYNLPFGDNSFDVVQTNFVVFHLANPIDAIKEMRRVCKPGGFIALREGYWDAQLIYPFLDGLCLFTKLCRDLWREAGASIYAGAYLIRYAMDVGFERDRIEYIGGTQTFNGVARTAQYGKIMADRLYTEDKWKIAVGDNQVTQAQVDEMADAWRQWSMDPCAVWSILVGQIVCIK